MTCTHDVGAGFSRPLEAGAVTAPLQNCRRQVLLYVVAVFLLLFSSPSALASPLSWKDTQAWITGVEAARASARVGQVENAEDRQILERFRPRIFVAPNGDAPIDFYKDYLPRTVVRSRTNRKKVLEKSPSRQRLSELFFDRNLYLDYQGPDHVSDPTPKAYARISREQVNLLDRGRLVSRSFSFLKYNFVFLHAGLPSSLHPLKESVARLFGDPQRWQELHTRGAVYVVLDESGEVIAVILAQYNYHRTFLRDVDFHLPLDGRIKVSFSERSMQPYVMPEGNVPVQRRAVLDLAHLSYVMTGEASPWWSGTDIVHPEKAGAQEVNYEVEYLEEFDPLYTSPISLGKAIYLPGGIENAYRRGGLGMNFSTWPELLETGNLMQFWYLREGDGKQAAFMEKHLQGFLDVDFDTILIRNSARFGDDFLGGALNAERGASSESDISSLFASRESR